MSDVKKQLVLAELIQKELDGSLTDQEFESLQSILIEETAAVDYYVKTIISISVISENNAAYLFSGLEQEHLAGNPTSSDLWKELAREEKTAPAIEIPEEKPERQLIQKVVYPELERVRISRFQKVSFAISVAAALIIVAFMIFVPPPKPAVEVAMLVDQIDLAWGQESQRPYFDGRMTQGIYALTEGYASIRFYDGASVTVEAPAEISLNSSGDMELLSGSIYAIVPLQAQGFAVTAGGNKIVDLGTEFGIEIGNTRDVQLHVTKGKTMLFSGVLKNSMERIEVGDGSAKKVYSDGFVKDIPVDREKFVRRINSKSHIIERRERVEVIYEPFDYPAGSLDGQNGASEIGLDGTWIADETTTVASESLDVGDLISYGGSIGNLTMRNNRLGGARPIKPSALVENGLLDDGATLWFSVVLGYGNEVYTTNARLAFALANNQFSDARYSYTIEDTGFQVGSGIGLTLGRVYGGNGKVFATHFRNPESGEGFSGNVFGDFTGTSVYEAGQYGLIVGKIVWGAEHDIIELYQPDLNFNPGLPISTLKTNVDQSTFDTITFSRNGKVVLDEIRFGKTYSAVLGRK